jgi:hypothetical protein
MTAFRQNYEADSSDDDEDVLGQDAYRTINIDDESQQPSYDAPVARKDRSRRSPEPESLMPLPRPAEAPKLSWKQRHEMLQAAIEANKEVCIVLILHISLRVGFRRVEQSGRTKQLISRIPLSARNGWIKSSARMRRMRARVSSWLGARRGPLTGRV